MAAKQIRFVFDNEPCHNVDLNPVSVFHIFEKLPAWSPMFTAMKQIFVL